MPTDKEALRIRLKATREKSIMFPEEEASTLRELSEEMGTFSVHATDVTLNHRGRFGIRQVEVRMN